MSDSIVLMERLPRAGDVVLVHGCRLRLAPGWELCRPEFCKTRPCWIASIDLESVIVLPFTRDAWRSPVHFRAGEGGLRADSALVPTVVTLHRHDVLRAFGRIDPTIVRARFEREFNTASSVLKHEIEAALRAVSGLAHAA